MWTSHSWMAHDLIHDNLGCDYMNRNSSSSQWEGCTFIALLQLGNWNVKGVTTAKICNRKYLTKCSVTVLCHPCLSSLPISSSDSEMYSKIVENEMKLWASSSVT